MGQNATQYGESQHLGSVTMFVAPYATPTVFTELGIGEGFSYAETITPLDGTPDNGEKPDALYGVAEQTAEISGTLWSQNLSVINIMRGGIDSLTVSATTGVTTFGTGGLSAQKPVLVKVVQKTKSFATATDVTRWITTPIAETVVFALGDPIVRVMTTTFFKTTLTSGENLTYTNDKDGNPILKYPFTMSAKSDPTVSAVTGNLFQRVESVELPA